MGILKLENNIEYVFVDFFDTTMFRHIHSSQLLLEWEKALRRKFPNLRNVDLIQLRNNIISQLGGNELEIQYEQLIHHIYKEIQNEIDVSENNFYNISLTLEMYQDMAVQYPNKTIINKLYKWKEQGKKIYLVTDYFLPGTVYNEYLKNYHLEDLFDHIFCSSDYGASKASGKLYKMLLEKLGINASNVTMIGDSKESDYINAKKCGLNTIHYMPYLHKIRTNIQRKMDTSVDINKIIFNHAFKDTEFGEYSLVLYYFCQNLYQELKKDDVDKIHFLSRGGYLLKKSFDVYQTLEIDQKIPTNYFHNSRKVNYLAKDNKEDFELLKKYFQQEGISNEFCFVDEGWYTHGQIIISEIFGGGLTTKGYYLGIIGRPEAPKNCLRKGILFDNGDENIKKSRYYGVFRTNCTFYEQILTAPEGSLKKYIEEPNGQIKFDLVWEQIEKDLYLNNTVKIQENLIRLLKCLASWNQSINDYELAKYILKTLLIANKKRVRILNVYDQSYYDNMNATTNKEFGDVKKLHINFLDLIIHPNNYLRYLCKVKNLTQSHKVVRYIYSFLGYIIYWYCLVSLRIS